MRRAPSHVAEFSVISVRNSYHVIIGFLHLRMHSSPEPATIGQSMASVTLEAEPQATAEDEVAVSVPWAEREAAWQAWAELRAEQEAAQQETDARHALSSMGWATTAPLRASVLPGLPPQTKSKDARKSCSTCGHRWCACTRPSLAHTPATPPCRLTLMLEANGRKDK